MPRDYAKSNRRNKKQGQVAGWVWMLGGLTIGLFVAFLVYLNNSQHSSQKNALAKVIKETIQDVRDVKKQQAETPPPPKDPDTDKPKPSFDFYYILPELEVAVPEQELAAQSKQAQHSPDQKLEYILQAGSFRQLKQADELKAKLALQGIDANIQTVNINSDTWHRVRIGPIQTMGKLNQTRKRLMENGISSIVVKSKT